MKNLFLQGMASSMERPFYVPVMFELQRLLLALVGKWRRLVHAKVYLGKSSCIIHVEALKEVD
jgi:hypothetical protein